MRETKGNQKSTKQTLDLKTHTHTHTDQSEGHTDVYCYHSSFSLRLEVIKDIIQSQALESDLSSSESSVTESCTHDQKQLQTTCSPEQQNITTFIFN